MNLRNTIIAWLLNYNDVNAVVDTRIYDASSMDTQEGIIPDTIRDPITGSILPFIVIRFGGASASDANFLPRAFVKTINIFVYDQKGYNTVEYLKGCIKTFFSELYITGDDVKVAKIVWAGELGEFIAVEMEHCYADMISFEIRGME